jgi:hypothetical protein
MHRPLRVEDFVRLRYVVALGAVLGGGALPAAGQFTTAVYPPRAPRQALAKARTDSSKRADSAVVARRMTDMRTWVDSVALVLADRPISDSAAGRVDTTTAAESPRTAARAGTGSAAAKRPRGNTTAFRNGAPAPETATAVPMFALVGLAALAAGALLRRP